MHGDAQRTQWTAHYLNWSSTIVLLKYNISFVQVYFIGHVVLWPYTLFRHSRLPFVQRRRRQTHSRPCVFIVPIQTELARLNGSPAVPNPKLDPAPNLDHMIASLKHSNLLKQNNVNAWIEIWDVASISSKCSIFSV